MAAVKSDRPPSKKIREFCWSWQGLTQVKKGSGAEVAINREIAYFPMQNVLKMRSSKSSV
jgi:hypothetical protein